MIRITTFILFTFYWVFMLKCISSTYIRINTEESPFDITGVSTEPKNALSVKLIFESEIGFLLEIDRCLCDSVDMVLYLISPSVITTPWAVVLTENLWLTPHQKLSVSLFSLLSCLTLVRGERWVEVIII